MRIILALVLLLVACEQGGGSLPPAPTYERSTLLVRNQSDLVLDIVFRCCGNQVVQGVLLPETNGCLVMNKLHEIDMEARSSDGVYSREERLTGVEQSPAWSWTLLPYDDQLKPETDPCA